MRFTMLLATLAGALLSLPLAAAADFLVPGPFASGSTLSRSADRTTEQSVGFNVCSFDTRFEYRWVCASGSLTKTDFGVLFRYYEDVAQPGAGGTRFIECSGIDPRALSVAGNAESGSIDLDLASDPSHCYVGGNLEFPAIFHVSVQVSGGVFYTTQTHSSVRDGSSRYQFVCKSDNSDSPNVVGEIDGWVFGVGAGSGGALRSACNSN